MFDIQIAAKAHTASGGGAELELISICHWIEPERVGDRPRDCAIDDIKSAPIH
jgi:hypothetical protein